MIQIFRDMYQNFSVFDVFDMKKILKANIEIQKQVSVYM